MCAQGLVPGRVPNTDAGCNQPSWGISANGHVDTCIGHPIRAYQEQTSGWWFHDEMMDDRESMHMTDNAQDEAPTPV